MRFVADLIERNAEAGGWLVFAAHDISHTDWAFGCEPAFFTEVPVTRTDPDSFGPVHFQFPVAGSTRGSGMGGGYE